MKESMMKQTVMIRLKYLHLKNTARTKRNEPKNYTTQQEDHTHAPNNNINNYPKKLNSEYRQNQNES